MPLGPVELLVVQFPGSEVRGAQAWATGTPLLLIRTMLGLEPVGDRLAAHPVVPKTLGQLQVSGIPGRWGRTDVFGKGRVAVPESVDHLERLMV